METISSPGTITELTMDWVSPIQVKFEEITLDVFNSYIHKVEILSLRSNGLSDSFAKILSEALVKNQNLLSVNLWDNSITDQGAIMLGDALRANKNLLSLSLGKNKIGNSGAEYLLLSVTRFKLSVVQLFDRKKTIRELEKRKKESINRRRRVTKGKSKKTGASTIDSQNISSNPPMTPTRVMSSPSQGHLSSQKGKDVIRR